MGRSVSPGRRGAMTDVAGAEARGGGVRAVGRLHGGCDRAGPAAPASWPKVTSYPRAAELGAALGAPLAARILLLDPQAPFGYVRDWQPPGLAPLRHLAYAIQWWSFATLALIVWAILSTRRNPAAPTR